MNRPIALLALTATLSVLSLPMYADDSSPASRADVAAQASSGNNEAGQAQAHDCLRETGSLIRPATKDCTDEAGDAYEHSDLASTGETTAGAALGQLDPRVTVRGR